jgi:hypothetical protein
VGKKNINKQKHNKNTKISIFRVKGGEKLTKRHMNVLKNFI